MRLLVIDGPNMNMLGIREKEIYGSKTYGDLVREINNHCAQKDIFVKTFQSNHEGEIVDEIQNAYKKFDAIIINPAAYTHTSVAIADALLSVGIPYAEVHISDPDSREDFRKINFVRKNAASIFKGEGFDSYIKAIDYLESKFGSTV